MKLFGLSTTPSAAFEFVAAASVAPEKFSIAQLIEDECIFSSLDQAESFLTKFVADLPERCKDKWWGPLTEEDVITYLFSITNLSNQTAVELTSVEECRQWIASTKEKQRVKFVEVARQLIEVKRSIAEKDPSAAPSIDLSKENEERLLSSVRCYDKDAFDKWLQENLGFENQSSVQAPSNLNL